MKPQLVTIVWLVASGIIPAKTTAQPPAGQEVSPSVAQFQAALVDVIARAEPAVVAVTRATQQPVAADRFNDVLRDFRQPAVADESVSVVGAGVIIDRQGHVLTHYLAVNDGQAHAVTTVDGMRYPATVRAADPRSGLAVLKIDPSTSSPQRAGAQGPVNLTALRFGDAAALRKGQLVVAIGNPYAIISDGQPTASCGIVTNLARKAPAGTNFNDAPGPNADHRTTLHHLGTLIQTDARLGWSAAGGALINLRGELVGLSTTAASIAGHEQPAGYAIPINALMRRVIETLRQGREVEYGLLGVGFGQAVVQSAPQGPARLSIAQVYAGGPAARGGLQAGDVITRVGGQPVEDVDAIQLAVSEMPPSTTATIDYQREGRAATTRVTLGKLAVAGKVIATTRPSSWRGIRLDYATAMDAAQLSEAISSGAYDAEGCVLVTEVEPDSIAWRAGIRPGMFISHVGGERVATPQEFRAAAEKLSGDALNIRLTQPADAQDSQ